jgi:hypothetical protein
VEIPPGLKSGTGRQHEPAGSAWAFLEGFVAAGVTAAALAFYQAKEGASLATDTVKIVAAELIREIFGFRDIY